MPKRKPGPMRWGGSGRRPPAVWAARYFSSGLDPQQTTHPNINNSSPGFMRQTSAASAPSPFIFLLSVNRSQLPIIRCRRAAVKPGEFTKRVYDSKFTKRAERISFVNSPRGWFVPDARQGRCRFRRLACTNAAPTGRIVRCRGGLEVRAVARRRQHMRRGGQVAGRTKGQNGESRRSRTAHYYLIINYILHLIYSFGPSALRFPVRRRDHIFPSVP